MVRRKFTSLVLNAALAALPVATYVVTDAVLRAIDTLTEARISDGSEGQVVQTSQGGPEQDEAPSPAPQSGPGPASFHQDWLKAEPFELSLRTSRTGRAPRLPSGPSDALLPPPARGAAPRIVQGCFDRYGPAVCESTRLVRLAPAVLAHAPPQAI